MKLRSLAAGHFFAFGPGLSDEVVPVKIGDVQTNHPVVGQRNAPVPPPRDKIKKVLAQLQDLPHALAQEESELQRLRRENQELRGRTGGTPRIEVRDKVVNLEIPILTKQDLTLLGKVQNSLTSILEKHRNISVKVGGDPVYTIPSTTYSPNPIITKRHPASPDGISLPKFQINKSPGFETSDSEGLKGPEKRILDAIAWMESIGIPEPDQTAVAFLAGYTVGGGAFNNPRGALRTKGLIRYNGFHMSLTEEGRSLATVPATPLTEQELHGAVRARLPGPERKILDVLLPIFPDDIDKVELASTCGYAVGGAFNNPLGRLRTLGLIEYPEKGRVKASSVLFIRSPA